MSTGSFCIHAPRAIIDELERPATICVEGGVIAAIETLRDSPSDDRPGDHRLAADEVLIPGLVDTHIHVNEPGRTEWEGFDTATDAARAGGVTTIIDMPLNSLPPTLDVDALDTKRLAAQPKARVDVGFWGGLVPGNIGQLPDLLRAGVYGVKCFLQDSGVSEFPPVSPDQLRTAMEVLAGLDGLLLVHAEDPDVLASAPAPNGASYDAFVSSRPAAAESRAIATVIAAVRETGARAHIVHLSSGSGAELIRAAKAEGLPISAETCPHYLSIRADQIPDGQTQFKCCPPIRGRADQDALWAALVDGTIDIVVTDHSPSTPDLKLVDKGDLGRAWGGIASVQFGFAATWTAASDRGIGLSHVVHWMSKAPADLVGLARKGRIAAGADADLVVLAPNEEFIVRQEQVRHRHPLTPYLGRQLRGVAGKTWLRGHELDEHSVLGELLSKSPHVTH